MERAEVIRNMELATAERDAWNGVVEAFAVVLKAMDGNVQPETTATQNAPSQGALVRRLRKGADGSPRGAEAVHQVLKANPGHEMDVKALLAAVTERGWISESKWPENSMSSAAARAWEHVTEVQRRRAGYGFVYWYEPTVQSESRGFAAQLAANLADLPPSTNGHHLEEVTP